MHIVGDRQKQHHLYSNKERGRADRARLKKLSTLKNILGGNYYDIRK